ncbi:MAG TPA: VOC family protein [Steroidobacteraceae bacterium]|jgi:catechol 2,3-dioxygenase-like lactoylglutathione lyase family enzyme|nr:VOC family protein [Steroidobacteraceae bacterium]
MTQKRRLQAAEWSVSRRQLLTGLGVVALLPLTSRAADPQLPLKTTGLEHMGTVVPDVEAAGKFYGRLFNPELHKEKEPPLRYYVTLGVGYLALGTRANQSRAFFDHYCALVSDYDQPAMAEALKAKGLPGGRFGIIPDPDGIGLQLLGVPGGLAKSTEPAGRIVEGDSLVKPLGLREVVLHVPDVEKSLTFYREFFGREAVRGRKPDAAWFQIAGTRLRLEKADAGEEPRVNRIGIQVQKFNAASVGKELTKMGATLEKSGTRGGLRFRDPLGLGLELLQS